MAKKVARKRRVKKNVEAGVAHIRSTFNNTIVMITDVHGNAISWSSAGSLGFRGSRKSTPYAAQIAVEQAAARAKTLHNLEKVDVYVKGIWVGREQAIRWLISGGLELRAIFDVTPVPHNGCRKKKVRSL